MAVIPVRKFKVGDEVIIRDMGGLKAKVVMIEIPRTPVGIDVFRPVEPTIRPCDTRRMADGTHEDLAAFSTQPTEEET